MQRNKSLERKSLAVALLALLLAYCVGCGSGGLLGGPREEAVKVEYHGLDHHTIAVLVAADDQTLYAYPGAPAAIGQALSSKLATTIPGAKLTNPQEISAFQQANPYWETLPYGDLVRRLGVHRLVFVDLAHYATHEPGDANVWQGVMEANVAVIEAEAANPHSLAWSRSIEVRYPEDKTIGVLNSDDATIQLGMLASFSDRVIQFFHQDEK